MRLSKSYWQTYKETPSDAEVPSHQLLMRAGFLNKTTGGIYSYLPMATKVLQNIKEIIRDELNQIHAQEIAMSFVTPSELWKKSGRWDTMGPLMAKLKDRKEADFCLSPTNEETITDIFSNTINSYKQLPVNLYQIGTKFRDEIRPRFGILRGREFIMKDAYTFHMNKKCMDDVYGDYFKAYSNIFNRMGLEFIAVKADAGAMASGDAKTHEFQIIADTGEDDIVEAKEINYAANVEASETYRVGLEFTAAKELKDIRTIGMDNCKEVAKYLDIPPHNVLKTLVFTVVYPKKEVEYIIMLLGDDSLNEVKLENFIKGAVEIKPANQQALDRLGMVAGYMSPISVNSENTVVIYDTSVDMEASYIVGANKQDHHLEGFVPARDTTLIPKNIDLRLAKEGDVGPDKKTPVVFRKGIEAGHIFQLGDKYTKSMKAAVLDQNGKKVTPLMGCYGIGVSRIMAAAIEQSHDENGIIWPVNLAPYDVYLAVIGKKDETKKLSTEIYENLKSVGIQTILDDRGMGPGGMFKDADLLGLPIRLLLGERDFESSGELEIKVRSTGEVIKVKVENLESEIKKILIKLGKKC